MLIGQHPLKSLLSVCLSFCPLVCPSANPPTRQSTHPSVCPSLSFLKIGLLVFSDIVHDVADHDI